ncbi:MAG: N-acetylglucosamine-6-phosphate deacetylase [Planctomycetales bacterium]|nr:N-acetylglucosamine-6-phosphate deacetylase [Planctomycetales bacterium]
MPGMLNCVDLQINGYLGHDFNGDDLADDALHVICEQLARDGVAHFLPTVITDELPVMQRRLARLVELRDGDPLAETMVSGLHIEGPFLNETPGYIGAHPKEAARLADVDAMRRLLEAAGGLARIVTLAPERDPGLRTTKMLADQGIVVAAGHCDPSLDELRAAIDAGLSMFTHLGNGCPMQMHRHDNIVQRVLSLADQLWVSFIADGAHVPFFALKNYLKLAGFERTVVVTDAISAAGQGPGRYRLAGWEIEIGEDLVPWAPDRSHFVGSASTMPRMIDNLRGHVGLTDAEIDRLVVENPGRILGLVG